MPEDRGGSGPPAEMLQRSAAPIPKLQLRDMKLSSCTLTETVSAVRFFCFMRTIKRARSVNPTSAQILKLNLKCSVLAPYNSNLLSTILLLSACLLSNYFSYERVNTSGDVCWTVRIFALSRRSQDAPARPLPNNPASSQRNATHIKKKKRKKETAQQHSSRVFINPQQRAGEASYVRTSHQTSCALMRKL